MESKFRIDGIYDKRTIQHFKMMGLKDFCFDFSPKSFNFVQEYVFFEQLLIHLDPDDRLFFHFDRSNDPMIEKLIHDLHESRKNLKNVFFEIDVWSEGTSPQEFKNNYLLKYSSGQDYSKYFGSNFKGFIFQFSFLSDLFEKKLINNFASNFYTKYHSVLSDDVLMILQNDWGQNSLSSLNELFDFDLFSYPINSKIEICYRNVDLKKLDRELEYIKKNQLLTIGK